MVDNKNSQQAQDTLFVKMAYERCENYMGAARAILYVHETDQDSNNQHTQKLFHIINLMAQEITTLSNILENENTDTIN